MQNIASTNCKAYLFLYYDFGLFMWIDVKLILKFGDLLTRCKMK